MFLKPRIQRHKIASDYIEVIHRLYTCSIIPTP